MSEVTIYKPRYPIRIVTAASLFDGHDAAINLMRRILQTSGAEVIHLGHDRSVQEIVECAIQEDVQAIAVTSYQGGHMEFFKYMYDLLQERRCGHIRIFGGGGGVILPHEIEELHAYGITRIYSPDDGRRMGLQGMINDLLEKCDFPAGDLEDVSLQDIQKQDYRALGRLITAIENKSEKATSMVKAMVESCDTATTPVIGITGTGGAGKSSLTDEVLKRMLVNYPDKKFAVVSVDPTKRRSGGALLGDRIRMNSASNPRIFMRSLATRQAHQSLSKYISEVLCAIRHAGFDLIFLESSGIGQSDTAIVDHSDLSIYVMTPEYGAPSQLEKIDMIDFADFVIINKADKRGAADALRDVRKQYQRTHLRFDEPVENMPVFLTISSQFNDAGVNRFFEKLTQRVSQTIPEKFYPVETGHAGMEATRIQIIPPNRERYLSEIAETVRNYNRWARQQADLMQKLQAIEETLEMLDPEKEELRTLLKQQAENLKKEISGEVMLKVEEWPQKARAYREPVYTYKVRGKEICVETHTETLSHLRIPKVALPEIRSKGDLTEWLLKEGLPGEFPYAAGVFPFRREAEDPTRMFAGEGCPERTNKRFHYLSAGMPAIRLSTAFDSVTLYGRDPGLRPDIYGKIGNSGVSICCLDDMKKLYSGFNLADPKTSVSMTINGPAPAMVGYFMNAAIDQQCEIYIRQNGLEDEVRKKIEALYAERGTPLPKYNMPLPDGNNGLGLLLLGITGDQVLPQDVYEKIKTDTLNRVRGTVQADILKEDQAQNTCIFSTDFSLKLMGDIQQYFIDHKVTNFYSVSISGYHIAEAGANPITQLAFTLANGFTFVEYYLGRGMHIDDFAPNLSFFFSNGLDAEYSVMGRVARLIWAKAMKLRYGANARSQMLKYHIQTSGRSLHAQEIDFNDIRTTLQALYALYDSCNSLHTNAYDEAITTPTEESVRRAMAIQLIINHELGLNKNQNPLQGAFIIRELTQLVEEAVLQEFERLNERGGVLGAMETMYQRSKIQEESLYYETLKHSGKLPVIGVNTFLSKNGSPTIIPDEVIRATEEEKHWQLATVKNVQKTWEPEAREALAQLKKAALSGRNLFEELMDVTKFATLEQITTALFEVGGQYRRNM
ncbi:MAG: isobutyryl-CoA mutase [Bacteroidales bacterium]|jgi:methylmalonyl-CoA mutase|nr:isobutyryl-CoA mutase [Bacteroidales bacterium]MDN5328587.1 isobutyryl-CoA mutase [Bacteroidales bacterium]